jgi:signal transduction histidine kinase
MKVRTRLLAFGAVLPVVGTLAGVLVAGELFHLSLLRAMDRGLAELAAVESVTLFDGPGGYPHLPPVTPTPNAHELPLPAGVVAVYGLHGRPLIKVPPDIEVPASVADRLPGQPLSSHALDGKPTRELTVVVSAHDGKRFPLWVARPLAEVDATTASFFQVSLSVCAGMAVVLFAIQVWQARRLSARIGAVTQQLPRLREGDFETQLPPDPTGDEVAALRDALEEATLQLRGARDRQERLIGNAAHEIQTPLACMRTLVDLALIKDRTPTELRQALSEARAEIDRLAALARDLLELAAAEQVKLDEQEIDLLPVLRASAESFRPEAGRRGLELRQEPAGEGPGVIVRGSGSALRRALDNLVANALKFSPEGGLVRLTLEREGPTPGRVRVLVTDEGPGVPVEDRAKIFEPFYRTRRAGGGTGLGLPIAREVARQHGGDIVLLPSERGARFALELPALAGAAPAARRD